MIAEDIKEKSKLTVDEWREYTKTVWSIANTSHEGHPAVFPIEIPHRLIKLFTFWGDTVLDPFGGVGNTACAALPIGRKAVCVDQNEEYVAIMRTELGTKKGVQIVHGDSRKLPSVKDDSIGLVVTSPPYWNKADYGKGEANVGNVGNYIKFFAEIRPIFEECYRTLMPGRKLCLVTAHVNQHTNHGLLTFPLATDFTILLRDIGFVMVNEIIWNKDGTGGKWGSANDQRPIFGSYPYPPNFHFKNVHEYILIMAKPSGKKVNGPKVQNYESLMSLTLPEQVNGSHALNGAAHGTNGATAPKRRSWPPKAK
ncbi:site-specific DNA-methyltransferase [Zavarzinella formosa]|uniref:site-specific DNA-methyltransferase n=1 Tax=Zavarzinella formosa TaxID=360055 RepID=UPI0002EDF8E1|nr:site-specific DNA-methyltransferase [Zavarzinella formosa]